VEQLMARCRAYVYAGLEDFGIAPVEAMAAGAPVIGLGQGGLLDSVRCLRQDPSTATGMLFPHQQLADLQGALAAFEAGQLWQQLPAERLRLQAESFAPAVFRQRLSDLLLDWWDQHRRGTLGSVPVG